MTQGTTEPKDLSAELRGFAEGSTSARASLMRDAADMIDLLERDRNHWRDTFREFFTKIQHSPQRHYLAAILYEFSGALMPSPVERDQIRRRFVERRRREA